MSDSDRPDLDLGDLLARLVREYEEIIATVIERPVARLVSRAVQATAETAELAEAA